MTNNSKFKSNHPIVSSLEILEASVLILKEESPPKLKFLMKSSSLTLKRVLDTLTPQIQRRCLLQVGTNSEFQNNCTLYSMVSTLSGQRTREFLKLLIKKMQNNLRLLLKNISRKRWKSKVKTSRSKKLTIN